MPNYRRWFVPGATYFFTVVTDRRAPLFGCERARAILGNVFRECRGWWPFEVNAIVLLPDHLHCLWTLPPGDEDYPRRWAWLKGQFTRRWLAAGGAEVSTSEGHRRDGRRGVLQPRYWEHVIRDETDFTRHADYIHLNPVRHGHAACPRDWPHSSFARCVRTGDYPSDWGCGPDTPPSFANWETSAMEPALRGRGNDPRGR